MIVSKPRKRVGHDPKSDRCAREKKEEEAEEDGVEDAGEEEKEV
jgi:hypothetical protein